MGGVGRRIDYIDGGGLGSKRIGWNTQAIGAYHFAYFDKKIELLTYFLSLSIVTR